MRVVRSSALVPRGFIMEGSVTPRAIDAGGGTGSASLELPLNGVRLRWIALPAARRL
jgi:hypothetical protein